MSDTPAGRWRRKRARRAGPGPAGRPDRGERPAVPGRDRAAGRRDAGDEAVPLLLLEVSQILLAGAQLGAITDVDPGPATGAGRRRRPGSGRAAGRAGPALAGLDDYAELFDPYADTGPRRSSCRTTWPRSRPTSSTGCSTTRPAASSRPCGGGSTPTSTTGARTAGAALRALQSVVAHARLDVAEERTVAVHAGLSHRPGRGRINSGRSPASRRASVRSALPVALVVQKYGGSSVADADGIKRVAQRIVADAARPATTSSSWSRRWATPPTSCSTWPTRSSPLPPGRELDMLLTAGERISMALLAMAIANLGYRGPVLHRVAGRRHHRRRRTATPGSST